MKRIVLSSFVYLIVSLLAVSALGAALSYTDKLGRVVKVSVPVKRAVFFESYELIPALGVWDKVVGVGRWAYENDLIRATRPDIEQSIPSAGTGTDINIEALLNLKPDMVLTWTFKPENVRFMEQKGLKVIAIYPESFSELMDVMRMHGRLFGRERQMERAIAEMDRIFQSIRQRVANIPAENRKKVLWLGSKPTVVACGVGVTDDLFKLIGANNPAASIPQRNADISIERIIAWNPDVLFIWGYAKYTAKDIVNQPQWRFIRAVRNNQVYKTPEWSTWSPRLAPAALWMAMKCYPDRFKDIHLEEVTDDFYRKVFGIPYRMVKRFEG
jgi:iron complex transport system substrate-binding protein